MSTFLEGKAIYGRRYLDTDGPMVSNLLGTVKHSTGRSVMLCATTAFVPMPPSSVQAGSNQGQNDEAEDEDQEQTQQSEQSHAVDPTAGDAEPTEPTEPTEHQVDFNVALGWYAHENPECWNLITTRQAGILSSNLDDIGEGVGAFVASLLFMDSLQAEMAFNPDLRRVLGPSFETDPEGLGTICSVLQGYYNRGKPRVGGEDRSRGVLLAAVDMETFERAAQRHMVDMSAAETRVQEGDQLLGALLGAHLDALPWHADPDDPPEKMPQPHYSCCTVLDQDGNAHILVAEDVDAEGNIEPGWDKFKSSHSSTLHRLLPEDAFHIAAACELVRSLREYSRHIPSLQHELFGIDPSGFATCVQGLQSFIDWQADAESDAGSTDSAMDVGQVRMPLFAVSQRTFMDAFIAGTVDSVAHTWLPTNPVMGGIISGQGNADDKIRKQLMRSEQNSTDIDHPMQDED